jgi:metal-responsive CopG/Arc/MetJ family transcriptional regulator
MPILPRVSTTDMEVTSIRLEKDLKERLKAIAGSRGYQALIREVLWTYVDQQAGHCQSTLGRQEIRATIPATAERPERCALTGAEIAPQEDMLLGLTPQGALVPLCRNSLTELATH